MNPATCTSSPKHSSAIYCSSVLAETKSITPLLPFRRSTTQSSSSSPPHLKGLIVSLHGCNEYRMFWAKSEMSMVF
ncbi:hypothetical protein GBA52_003731 [Prunus armeniaca]|nr:hypothetical protein GBA52_003731 [Prunus armeniaca]